MPYITEEFWQMLGNKELIISQKFPEYDELKIDKKSELAEDFIRDTGADIESIIKLLGKKPQKIYIYVASDWKHNMHDIVKQEKTFDKIMKSASRDSELKKIMPEVQRVAKQLVKNAYSLQETLSVKEEYGALSNAIDFFKNQFSCGIFVMHEKDGKHERAKNALPGKPAIVIE